MTPEERDALLQRYYDGETVGNEAEAARRILEEDPEARIFLESLQLLSDKIQVEMSEAVGEEDFSEYWENIQARLPPGPLSAEVETVGGPPAEMVVRGGRRLDAPARPWLTWFVGPALGATAAAAVIFGLFVPAQQPVEEPRQVVRGMRAMSQRPAMPEGTVSEAETEAAPGAATARVDHSIDIENVESEGPIVLVLQDSPDEPAIIWFVETAADAEG